MAKQHNNIKRENSAKSEKRVNPNTLREALRNLKSRFATGDVKSMREISSAYATGMPFALGMSYDTMVKRFHNPEQLTVDDLLTISDITETEIDVVIKVALNEAKRNHIKRDISNLLDTRTNK